MVILPIIATKKYYNVKLLIDVDEVRRQTVKLETGGVFAGFTVPLKVVHIRGELELLHQLPRTTPAVQVMQFAYAWSAALVARLRAQLKKQRANQDAVPFPRKR